MKATEIFRRELALLWGSPSKVAISALRELSRSGRIRLDNRVSMALEIGILVGETQYNVTSALFLPRFEGEILNGHL